MEEATATPEPQKSTFNILFVCTGNTCRSPLAEVLAHAELEQRGWMHVRVSSAGSAALGGEPASAHSVTAASRRGLDLGAHRSRPLSAQLVAWADLVLAMSPSHLDSVEYLGGGNKVSLLGDFAAGDDGAGHPVPDPFGGELETYLATADELERLVRASIDRLAPILHP
jgi:protein-tyrosine-phosphatase